MPSTTQATLASPIGTVLITGDGERLLSLEIGTEAQQISATDPLLGEALRQLRAWFAGALETFDLPLAEPTSPRGAAHRDAIVAIPFGAIASYGAVAQAIGSSARAVGQACRRNPFPLIVPCHRVVGAAGTMGHYSAGDGIATKRWLLAFESRRAQLWAA